MTEEQELARLEEEWKDRFERFTAPEPTREDTFRLIEKIKAADEVAKPIDLRAQLEIAQSSLSWKDKWLNLFLSQWTFHGMKSWLLTGGIMLILSLTISQNMADEMTGFAAWIKWVTLIMIAVIGYAFRPKDEGNHAIETLSYYPLIQQMFARFMIVMVMQCVIAFPLVFVITGKAGILTYMLKVFTPLFFFGVVGFVSTVWLGSKLGLLLTIMIWFVQIFFDKMSFSLFTQSNLLVHVLIVGFSILLLGTVRLRYRPMRDSL